MDELRADLLALASNWRERSDNLLSEEWHKAWAPTPTIRQRQYGDALALREASDAVLAALGIDPLLLGADQPRHYLPVPASELSGITWS